MAAFAQLRGQCFTSMFGLENMPTPKSTKRLLRLISARQDIANAFNAYENLKKTTHERPAEHFFLTMVISYGRPFTENYKIGSITTEFPNFPDFADCDMNLRHNRMIDLRNKFLAHSSAEGTRVKIIPAGAPNPVDGHIENKVSYVIGKRHFLEPDFIEWLIAVVIAFRDRLDQEIQDLLDSDFADPGTTESYELQTGWNDFRWT